MTPATVPAAGPRAAPPLGRRSASGSRPRAGARAALAALGDAGSTATWTRHRPGEYGDRRAARRRGLRGLRRRDDEHDRLPHVGAGQRVAGGAVADRTRRPSCRRRCSAASRSCNPAQERPSGRNRRSVSPPRNAALVTVGAATLLSVSPSITYRRRPPPWCRRRRAATTRTPTCCRRPRHERARVTGAGVLAAVAERRRGRVAAVRRVDAARARRVRQPPGAAVSRRPRGVAGRRGGTRGVHRRREVSRAGRRDRAAPPSMLPR